MDVIMKNTDFKHIAIVVIKVVGLDQGIKLNIHEHHV